MKKSKILITGVILIILISSCIGVYAFDFGAWMKNILGIKDIEEQETEIFVPLDEIKTEEIVVIDEDIIEEETEGFVPLDEIKIEEEVSEEAAGEEETEEEVSEEEAEETEIFVPVDEIKIEEDTSEEEVVEEEAKVIIAQETDKISLGIDAEDPDEDELLLKYSSPLDEMGEWQTTYGDEGEYTVTVTASDGTLSDSMDVLIIVNKKEEAPEIDEFSPESLTLDVDENSKLEFSSSASDKNDDELSYAWKLDGDDVGTKKSFNYKMGYDDAGSHTVKLVVSDGSSETTKLWSVSVKNVNRKPKLKEIDDISVKETETVTIKPEATDMDGDDITFTISEPVGDSGVWETGYDDSGEYEVTVTASDGEDKTSQTVKITVENVNRAPVIKDIIKK